MQYKIYPHWDMLSIILYVLMGYLGAFAIKKGSKKPYTVVKRNARTISINSLYVIWWFLWSFVAAFRLINSNGIGGTDAWTYINYFKICNGGSSNIADTILYYAEHYEVLWKLFNKFVRIFTDNYHVLFAIVYGFIVWTYQKTINSFSYDRIYAAPFICLFFLYLRGFNTLRTELSGAFILLMVIALKKENYKKAIILGIVSVGIQISSALYCLFIPFHYLFKKGRLKTSTVVILLILAIVVGRGAQVVLTGSIGKSLGHMYFSYAAHNLGKSFLDNYWKIAFGQILIGVLILLFDKKLKSKVSPEMGIADSVQFVREVCLFDVITIPVTFILDIWRGYEYLYIMRLLMWSYVTYVFLKGKSSSFRHIVAVIEVLVFTAWLVFRINHTWESSGYLPYVVSIF